MSSSKDSPDPFGRSSQNNESVDRLLNELQTEDSELYKKLEWAALERCVKESAIDEFDLVISPDQLAFLNRHLNPLQHRDLATGRRSATDTESLHLAECDLCRKWLDRYQHEFGAKPSEVPTTLVGIGAETTVASSRTRESSDRSLTTSATRLFGAPILNTSAPDPERWTRRGDLVDWLLTSEASSVAPVQALNETQTASTSDTQFASALAHRLPQIDAADGRCLAWLSVLSLSPADNAGSPEFHERAAAMYRAVVGCWTNVTAATETGPTIEQTFVGRRNRVAHAISAVLDQTQAETEAGRGCQLNSNADWHVIVLRAALADVLTRTEPSEHAWERQYRLWMLDQSIDTINDLLRLEAPFVEPWKDVSARDLNAARSRWHRQAVETLASFCTVLNLTSSPDGWSELEAGGGRVAEVPGENSN